MPVIQPISIHAPREGGDRGNVKIIVTGPRISIHAPREGGDKTDDDIRPRIRKFQSTPPARGGDDFPEKSCIFIDISIHAPREGGDGKFTENKNAGKDFNPRPPRGGRHRYRLQCLVHLYFNPRPPRGGRPGYQYEDLRLTVISIHAPREGGDWLSTRGRKSLELFQSTPPARGATSQFFGLLWAIIDFNPRPPRGGRLWYV